MLKEQLMQDLKDAMKEKDTIKKDTVQMVRAAILQIEKDKAIEVDDAKIIEIIAKEVKGKKDALVDFEKGGRQDLIDQTNSEIDILSKYLPKQLSQEEIKEIVQKIVNDLGATSMKDMGPIMKEAKNKIGAGADGRAINEIVKELLSWGRLKIITILAVLKFNSFPTGQYKDELKNPIYSPSPNEPNEKIKQKKGKEEFER